MHVDEDLITINTTAGSATRVGALGFNGVHSLAFDDNGTLFGTDVSSDQLLTIDTSTGAATAVGPLVFGNIQGLAFQPESANGVIPEPSSLALLCIGVTGLFGYSWRQRRKRGAARGRAA